MNNLQTNHDHWNNYTSGLSSPQNFIDWGWLYLIGAALQRRVWIGGGEDQCFPNSYVILVGEPGIGKGLVLKRVSACLRHWLKKDALVMSHNAQSDSQKLIAQSINEKDAEIAAQYEKQMKNPQAPKIEPLLIPVAPDDITYEALTRSTSESYRRITYLDSDGKLQSYGHSSICFILPEFGSLMKKHSDNVVNYLLGLYDCPKDFEYKTKNSGEDRVRRGCINLIAGTTPSFMQDTFSDKLLGEGFTSRTFYIYANKNRKNQAFIPPMTPEQAASQKVILEHVRKLTTLYGEVHVEPSTRRFIEEWWDKDCNNPQNRSSKSMKMIPYYARKNIHVFKVAMQKHFSESLEMSIPQSCFEWAIDMLNNEEKNMHYAIVMEDKNPQSKMAKRILAYLSTGPKDWVEIMTELYDLGRKVDIEEALSMLEETNKIEQFTQDRLGLDTTLWRVKEERRP